MALPSFFTPIAGGALIGAAASLLLLTHGRIAGISGIVSGLVSPSTDDRTFRAAFIAGLLAAGLIGGQVAPAAVGVPDVSIVAIAVAGFLVGFGTRLGNGCTSGHGLCRLARLSRRSLVSVITFMVTAAVTVLISRHLVGGGL